jgi:hypothetical protein
LDDFAGVEIFRIHHASDDVVANPSGALGKDSEVADREEQTFIGFGGNLWLLPCHLNRFSRR